MKQAQQQRTSPPIEYWFVLVIALRASGLYYDILFIIGLYFLFKHLQPSAGFTLLTATSIYVGIAVAKIYGLLILYPDSYSILRIIEPVIVAFATVALLFTQKRGWAWALIIYSALSGLLFFIGAAYHIPKAANPKALFLAAVLGFVELWLLSSWLRVKPYVATLADIKQKDIDVTNA
jgi:hypothetical protein